MTPAMGDLRKPVQQQDGRAARLRLGWGEPKGSGPRSLILKAGLPAG
jgi:hypothetical protein